jgi:HEAT repeat protein
MALALGDLAGSAAVTELSRLMVTSDPGARLIAVDALGKIGGSRAVAALKVAIRDGNETVRGEAIRSLGLLAAAEVFRDEESPKRDSIENLLFTTIADDPSEYVRETAGDALVAIREAYSRRPDDLTDRIAASAISVSD